MEQMDRSTRSPFSKLKGLFGHRKNEDTRQASYDISVIVSIYNVESYLAACLESIAAQTKQDLQVILIDDGSTDRSGEIAKSFAQSHTDWEYHHFENGGLSAARNRGARLARGTYLSFVDSDDVLDPTMYQKLFDVALRDDSDMAICNAARIDSTGTKVSALHRRAFHNLPPCTHVTKNPTLVFDTTAWNKLIKRDFYEQSGLNWPEGVTYEDFPISSALHYLANHVSVINEPLYFWRIREDGQPSITQVRADMRYSLDRIVTCSMAQAFFEQHAPGTKALREMRVKVVEMEMPGILTQFREAPDDEVMRIMGHVESAIASYTTPELLSGFDARSAALIKCALNKDIETFRAITQDTENYAKAIRAKDDQGYRFVLPASLYGATRRSATTQRLLCQAIRRTTKISQKGDTLSLDGLSYYPRIPAPFGSQTFSASLINEVSGYSVPLRCDARRTRALTRNKGAIINPYSGEEVLCDYDGAGFTVHLDFESEMFAKIPEGKYLVRIDVHNELEDGFFLLGRCGEKTTAQAKGFRASYQGRGVHLELGAYGTISVVVCNQ